MTLFTYIYLHNFHKPKTNWMNYRFSFLLLLVSSFLIQGCGKTIKETPVPNFPATSTNQIILETQEAMGDSSIIAPKYLEVFTGDGGEPDFKDSTVKQNSQWKNYDSSIYRKLAANKEICWLRLTLKNNTGEAYNRLLCFDAFDRVELGYDSGKIERGGSRVPLKEWSYMYDNFCVKLGVDSHQSKTFYIKCVNQLSGKKHPFRFIMRTEQNEKAFQAFEMRSRLRDTAFLFFYLGFLFFAFIYFLAQFFFNTKEKILLIYALFILFTLLYSFRDVDKHYFLTVAFPKFNGINIWGEALFSYLSYIFYMLFAIYLFNLHERQEKVLKEKQENALQGRQKKAYWLLTTAICIISLLLAADIILHLSGNDVRAVKVFKIGRMTLFPLIIVYFVLLVPLWRSYYVYFLIGSVFLVLGAGINLLIFPLRGDLSFKYHDAINSKYGFFGNPVNFTRMGVILEVLFFSLGLAKKMRLEFAEVVIQENSTIENRFYTHEIHSGLTTLRSKLENDQEAKDYLTLFAKYLRSALLLMKYKTGIELSKEIEMIIAYFKLRQEDDDRFEFLYDYDGISPETILIPAGLLIPFVQNFFDHAVTDTDVKNRLEIRLYRAGTTIKLDLTDNGPGFQQKHKPEKNASSGLDIAQRKINLFNIFMGANLDFTIGNNKTSSGALITITNLFKKRMK